MHLIAINRQQNTSANVIPKILLSFIALFSCKNSTTRFFQDTEATNVLFVILRDCFIGENAVNFSEFLEKSHSINTPYEQLGIGKEKGVANQNTGTINFHMVRI